MLQKKSLLYTCSTCMLKQHTHNLLHEQVTTVILSDRLRSSLLCLGVMLVEPLLSYCTTAVVKPVTVCELMHICVKERESVSKGGSLAGGVN